MKLNFFFSEFASPNVGGNRNHRNNRYVEEASHTASENTTRSSKDKESTACDRSEDKPVTGNEPFD